MGIAVEVQDVSKHFRLYKEKYQSLKEKVIKFGRTDYENFIALDHVNLEIEEGSTTALMGHNGSGKSTLLKCIAGILQPTEGLIRTKGRMAALLELGAGMKDELTGRENIYLNGSILGLSKKDIDARFDDIVEFSELGQFIDTQVRFYSSGMYIRLGFAVAVNVEPDILLVDEVLAVGDEAFQNKCLDRVKQFQEEGRTIVVVTHAAELARRVCDHAAVLERGQKIADGPPSQAIRVLREHLHHVEEAVPDDESAAQDHPARLGNIEVVLPPGREKALQPGDPLTVRVGWACDKPVDSLEIRMDIHDVSGNQLFSTSSTELGEHIRDVKGKGVVTFNIDQVPFYDGDYLLTFTLTGEGTAEIYDLADQTHKFEVINPSNHRGMLALRASAQVNRDD